MKLKIEHITKSFGENQILQDVSSELEVGKVYVLMGANGSEKTTLFNILTGFLKAGKATILMENDIYLKLLKGPVNTR